MTVRTYPSATVTVAGQNIPVDSVTVTVGSPLDLHLPPTFGSLSGAEATVNVTTGRGVTDRANTIWHNPQAREGDPVVIRVDGTRVFTGVVDRVDMDLRGYTTTLACVDALAGFDRTFTAPGTLRKLAPRPGLTESVPTGASMLLYLDAAFEAIGAHSTVAVAGRTDLHAPMTGTTHPHRGHVIATTALDSNGDPITPWVEPQWVPMSGGRIGMRHGLAAWEGRHRDSSHASVGSWHLTAEIDPSTWEGTSYVKAGPTFDTSGFGFVLVSPTLMRVVTWDATGTLHNATYEDQGQTLTDIPIVGNGRQVERVLVVYNVFTQTLTIRLMWENDDVSTWVQEFTPPTGGAPTMTSTTRILRVRSTGRSVMGAVSLMSRAEAIGALDNDHFIVPRTVEYDLTASQIARWSLLGHPPVEDEPAVAFINTQTARRRTFLRPDPFGTIHVEDISSWATRPVKHTITDVPVAGDIDLDNVQLGVQRKRRYSRVRVKGQTVSADIAWGPGMKPNRIYAGARGEITLRPGDDPVELWLEPREDTFWAEPPDLAFRWAGEPATEPWHLPDDFARGRGSWFGGYVRNADNDNMYRWAIPGDVIYTVEQVAAQVVKITMAPGPGLAPGEEFVNFPNPESESLRASNPSKMTQPLPVLRGPAVGTVADVEGTSADLGYDVDGWGEHTEYITDVGFLAVSRGRAQILAQLLADSHTQDFGQAVIRTDLDPTVQVGDRVRIYPTSRADILLDGIVTDGAPITDVGQGPPGMTLKVWVLMVQGTGDTDYPPAYAGLAYAGLSYTGL